MKYFHLNSESNEKPIIVKVNNKVLNIVKRMSKLANLHAQLDKQLVKEFAKCNKIYEDEASDLICFYDFLVDASQYGCGFELNEISKSDYFKCKEM